ncbi:hypothetical protein GQ600_23726 [Phytophthora cactorum]|nr:hypothetical protein GQ600_23726 [Phytophthora cactorum]
MLTTKGISGACSNTNRCRQNRFYKLLSLAGVAVEKRRKRYPSYSPPVLVTVEQYMTTNLCLDDEKFCSKLNVYGAKNKKSQSSKVQSYAETAAILNPIASKLTAEPSASRVCISDNANGTRGLIEKISAERWHASRIPFTSFKDLPRKIKDQARRKWLSMELSSVIYKADRTIRPTEEMAERFSSVLGKIASSSLNVKEPEWQGCISSNLNQIRMEIYSLTSPTTARTAARFACFQPAN